MKRSRIAALTLAVTSALPVLAAPSALSEPTSAAVFAMLDRNEWCPGGGVFLDLQTGVFMLYPRGQRPGCADVKAITPMHRGVLSPDVLQGIRAAFLVARKAGLKRDPCDVMVHNGGPDALVIIGNGTSAAAPEDEGCWSNEAKNLFEELFQTFGETVVQPQRPPSRLR